MKPIYNLLIIVAILTFACTGDGKKGATSLEEIVPIIDITKQYPSKDIFVEDIFEVSYIPLGISDKVLLEGDEPIAYNSSDKIIAYNYRSGNVFTFDGEGNPVSHFNAKGQSGREYQGITTLVYDEENKEIIIQDYELKKRLQVYDENGNYKRTLPYPKDCEFKNVMNYNNKNLIAYERNYVDDTEKNHLARKKPYVFLSKQDGSIVSDIDIILDERISTTFKNVTETTASIIKMNEANIIEYDKGFVLSDVACDTAFYYDKHQKLLPFFIRQPPVLSMKEPKTVLFLNRITNEYFLISSFINEHNFITQERGEKIELIYDRNSDEIFSYNISYRDLLLDNLKVTPQPNMLLPADFLIELYEQNKLEGELKKIATQLEPDDNPVLMIAK